MALVSLTLLCEVCTVSNYFSQTVNNYRLILTEDELFSLQLFIRQYTLSGRRSGKEKKKCIYLNQ